MADVADAELVARSRRRDTEAFGALVERHQRLVLGVALARCGDPALAEDVAQEAFVSAWRDLDRLRDGDRVGSWVAGIARNLAVTAARRRERELRYEPADADATAPSPEDEVLEREDREFLQRALADVPDAHREALVLFYLEGESCVRIAEALGISEDLVKQRLSRGRRALRDSVAARVESALVRVRLGAGLRAGVIGAVTLAGTREAGAATTGKVVALMSTKTWVIGAAAIALAAGGGLIWYGQARAGRTDVGDGVGGGRAATSDASAPPRARKLSDPLLRVALRELIRAAAAQRSGDATSASDAARVEPSPESVALDEAYSKATSRDLWPFIDACIDEALQRDPHMAERLPFTFWHSGGDADVIPTKPRDPGSVKRLR